MHRYHLDGLTPSTNRCTQDKLSYLVELVEQCWRDERPLLIGTTSVNESELILAVLRQWSGPEFAQQLAQTQLLNAKPGGACSCGKVQQGYVRWSV